MARVSSGKYGGCEVFHHSISSSVEITMTYEEEVKQGVVEKVRKRLNLDYGQIRDLQMALEIAKSGNLDWLLDK
tara:strand:- start:12584 stop:12805 length:222 start_codon:yes stop_codon:yes gene_type:complete